MPHRSDPVFDVIGETRSRIRRRIPVAVVGHRPRRQLVVRVVAAAVAFERRRVERRIERVVIRPPEITGRSLLRQPVLRVVGPIRIAREVGQTRKSRRHTQHVEHAVIAERPKARQSRMSTRLADSHCVFYSVGVAFDAERSTNKLNALSRLVI